MDRTIVASKASHVFFAIALNEDMRNPWIKNRCCLQGTVPIGAKCLGIDIINKMLKTLWEPGILDVVRAWACFTLFHLFIDWSGTWRLLWFGVVVGCFLFALCFVVVCFELSVPDPSFWSGCPTMTILAQLNDCHSCNDERSFVQKKNQPLHGSRYGPPENWHETTYPSLPVSQIVPKGNMCGRFSIQLRIPDSNNCLIGDFWDSGAAGQNKRPVLFPTQSCSFHQPLGNHRLHFMPMSGQP